ncbi:hypothetical protein CHS0354_028816 [Potamilus streckersoni]|uniref:Uncharacterized protein n=1 Tax=Potamilus streckersoni TaxID=2493646 RepID=A0AAE0RYJ2_9BIVA|nr:hypothetical protein CHS0354_028816 [Potamilus streckersoni]
MMVYKMSNQQIAADLLRRASDALSSATTVPCAASTTGFSTPRPVSEINENLRNIFAPYSQPRNAARFPNPRRGNGRGRAMEPVSYWTHRFCLLASTSGDSVPTRDERKRLYDAGLGDKKINFCKDSDPAYFRTKLEESFPKLKSGGGFELLRSGISSRVFLERIRMPHGGYTSAYLADESNLGQAVCYIRPIQRDLDLSAITDCQEVQVDAQKEECLTCGQMIAVGMLRKHDDCEECPSPSKRRSQTTICQYACTTDNADKPAASKK